MDRATGRPDLVAVVPGALRIWFNTGSRFDEDYTTWDVANADIHWVENSVDFGGDGRRRETVMRTLVDFNADGLPDLVSGSEVSFNNGFGFDDPVAIDNGIAPLGLRVGARAFDPQAQSAESFDLVGLMDMNGDGLPDLVVNSCYDDYEACEDHESLDPWSQDVYVHYNTGRGFGPVGFKLTTPSGDFQAPVGSYLSQQPSGVPEKSDEFATSMMFDYNADGIADFLDTESRLWLGNNRGFENPVQLNDASGTGAFGYSHIYPKARGGVYVESHNRWIDLNGDGRLDQLWGLEEEVTGSPTFNARLPDYAPAFAMSQVANGLGSQVEVSYKPASSTTESRIPYPLDVVWFESHTTNGHAGPGQQTALAEYRYTGGLFENLGYAINNAYKNPGACEFRGFHQVEVIDSFRDSSVLTSYNQQSVSAGLVDDVLVRRASTGEVYLHNSYEYTPLFPAGVSALPRPGYPPGTHWPLPMFMAPTFEKRETCEGQTTCTTQGVRTTYNTTVGLPSSVDDFGKCLESLATCTAFKEGHRRHTFFYKQAEDMANEIWIVGVKEASGCRYTDSTNCQQESRVVLYHDDPKNGPDYIDLGLVKLIARYVDQDDGGEKVLTYNESYGLLLTETEFNTDHHTTVEYDYDTNFLWIDKKTTGPFSESYLTDIATGLRYQTTDANGVQRKVTQFDGYGRPLELAWQHPTKEPGWKWTQRMSYHDWEFAEHQLPVYSTVQTNVDEQADKVSLAYRFYDGDGKLLQETSRHVSSLVITSQVDYDQAGRLIHVYEPQIGSEETEPWSFLPLPQEADKTIYRYDLLDRVKQITKEFPDDPRTFTYGSDLSVTMDEPGPKLKTVSDGWGNIAQVIRGPETLNLTTQYTHDSHNGVIQVVDHEGKELRYTRDWLGNVTSMVQPGGSAWYFDHDYNGRITHSASPAGRQVDFDYDQYQRLITRTFTLDGVADGEVMYLYDGPADYGLGRLHAAQSEAGIAAYTYDPDGRTRSYYFTPDGPPQREYLIQYQYNPGGLPSRVEFPDGDAYLYTYNPDATELSLSRESDGYIADMRDMRDVAT